MSTIFPKAHFRPEHSDLSSYKWSFGKKAAPLLKTVTSLQCPMYKLRVHFSSTPKLMLKQAWGQDQSVMTTVHPVLPLYKRA